MIKYILITLIASALLVVGLSTLREFRHDRNAALFAREAEAFLREGKTIEEFLARFPDFYLLGSGVPSCPKIAKKQAPNSVEVRSGGGSQTLTLREAMPILSRSLEENELCRSLALFYRFGNFMRTTVSFVAGPDLRMGPPFEVQYYR